MNDTAFLESFENCTLPFEEWNHLAHLRVAWLYSCQHNLDDATDRVRTGIKAYNLATNTPEAIDRGYHETITTAFMRLVWIANRNTGPHKSFDDFCTAHPELLLKTALRRYYSRERIMTMDAKERFVGPDLETLPD